jgi:hypothetical protein
LKITKFQRAIVDVGSGVFFFLFGALLVRQEPCLVFFESLLRSSHLSVRDLLSFNQSLKSHDEFGCGFLI